jgi:hypothetical protein
MKEFLLALLLSESLIGPLLTGAAAEPSEPSFDTLEQQFRSLPLEARRQVGPLFWLHGDETRRELRQLEDTP